MCETATRVITLHSQSSVLPDCPSGYQTEWDGYSYLGSSLTPFAHVTQSLGSSGSCLKKALEKPFIECDPEKCSVPEHPTSAWLNAVSLLEHGRNFRSIEINLIFIPIDLIYIPYKSDIYTYNLAITQILRSTKTEK